MRFKLTLEVNRYAFGNVIPINYQYEQSAVIYRILSQASEQYATWLHDNGFEVNKNKRFKLFCYSRLKIENRQIMPREERIRILSDTVEWQISFLPEKSTQKFIQGLFANQTFEIGDKESVVQFYVRNVEVLPPPEYAPEMRFTTMSPICLRSKREGGGVDFISPDEPRAKDAMLYGLLSRYQAINGELYAGELDFDFTLLDKPKSVFVKIKSGTPEQTRMRGYMCHFQVKAPLPLMKILYESGVGEECSIGFGCVRI